MFTPGLAIFYLATILRLSHVCGVQWSRVWRKSRFLDHSIGRWQHAGAWALERRLSSPTSPSRQQDNMDRASQVLAQAYLLACLNNIVLSQIMATSLALHFIIVLADDPR
jgi:hypothetical protein